MTNKSLRWINILVLCVLMLSGAFNGSAQIKRSAKSTISGGVVRGSLIDTTAVATTVTDSLKHIMADSAAVDSLKAVAVDSLGLNPVAVDSLAKVAQNGIQPKRPEEKQKEKFFSDSMGLSKMCWISTVLPGYGQVYNKQLWKLPIIYGALGASTALFVKENQRYQPLKEEWDARTLTNLDRDDELDALQRSMIRSNTRRQLYLGAMVSSYIYSLADATVNYSTNDVSSVKKATTLATVCPGAGQIYNGSYWKLPFVVGGFATMIYVIDWNSRGYTRFKKAYALRYDYDENPDSYPDGSADEFGGRYSAAYLKSLRNSYRRNRDLCIIMTAGLYILQIIDAHVDAHLRDYDISDDLTLNIEPLIQSNYSPTSNKNVGTYGFNMSVNF
ncbi:MAG: DUF5683 domain-containing protein [Rikenellaceae bacterium]